MFDRKKYYIDNKERLLNYSKMYSIKIGKQHRKEYNHEYYVKNIDYIKEQNKRRSAIHRKKKQNIVKELKNNTITKYKQVKNKIETNYDKEGLIIMSFDI